MMKSIDPKIIKMNQNFGGLLFKFLNQCGISESVVSSIASMLYLKPSTSEFNDDAIVPEKTRQSLSHLLAPFRLIDCIHEFIIDWIMDEKCMHDAVTHSIDEQLDQVDSFGYKINSTIVNDDKSVIEISTNNGFKCIIDFTNKESKLIKSPDFINASTFHQLCCVVDIIAKNSTNPLIHVVQFLDAIKSDSSIELKNDSLFLPPLDTLMNHYPSLWTSGLKSQSKCLNIDSIEQRVKQRLVKDVPKNMHIVSIQSLFHHQMFQKFSSLINQQLNNNEPSYAPCIGYHCTWNRSNIPSILDNGLLAPGELTNDGQSIGSGCALWGKGLYLSPSFVKANQYSFKDEGNFRQMFVSLVSLGKSHRPVGYYTDLIKWLTEVVQMDIPSDCDSIVSEDQIEFVVKSGEQILPVFLITYGPSEIIQKRSTLNPKIQYDDPNDQIDTKDPSLKLEKAEVGSFFHRLPEIDSQNRYWLLQLNQSSWHVRKSMCKKTSIKMIYIIDKSKSMGQIAFSRLVAPTCTTLNQIIQPDSTSIVFFGRNVDCRSFSEHQRIRFDQLFEQIELENATNIASGIESATDVALKYNEKFINDHALTEASKDHKLITLFVFVSDGKDTINSDSNLNQSIDRCGKMIQGSQLSTIFKVVGIGKKSDTRIGMKARQSMQTLDFYEPEPISFCTSIRQLPMIASNMAKDVALALLDLSNDLLLSIDSSSIKINEGFITNFAQPPSTIAKTFIDKDGNTSILYKGIVPPEFIKMNNKWMKCYLSDQVVPINVMMQKLRKFATDVKTFFVCNSGGTNHHRQLIESMIHDLKGLVKLIKCINIDSESFTNMMPHQRVQMMKSKISISMEINTIINDVTQQMLSNEAEKMTSEQQARWLTKINRMKHGSSALKRRLNHDYQKFANNPLLDFDVSNHLNLLDKDSSNRSILSKMNQYEHLLQIHSFVRPHLMQISMLDVLYSLGLLGLGIRVKRSEASNVEPWLIRVTHVSTDYIDTCSIMCALQSDVKIRDSRSENVSDVVSIIINKNELDLYRQWIKTPIYMTHLAITFTRNPSLVLPYQQIALLANSLIRAVVQLGERLKSDPSIDVSKDESIIRQLTHTCINHVTQGRFWSDLVKALSNEDSLIQTLSEQQPWNIASIAKILIALLHPTAASLFSQVKNSSKLFFAILSESASRDARVQHRCTKDYDVNHEMRKLLGIDDADVQLLSNPLQMNPLIPTNLGDSFNKQTAKKISNRFFASSNHWSNVSIRDVCVFFHFLRFIHNSIDDKKSLKDHFRGFNMRQMITDHSENPFDHELFQIALYAQGLRYHTSTDRVNNADRLLHLTEPEIVIKALAREQREFIYSEKLREYMKNQRKLSIDEQKQIRLAKKRQRQDEFIKNHSGAPHLFTPDEIAKLNENRPKDDQLELSGFSGLLKHHCCFPKCHKYLVNLQTNKDRITGKRRGLYKHLEFFFHPQKYYIKGIHQMCGHYVKRHPSKSLNDVIQYIEQHLPLQHSSLRQIYLDTIEQIYKRFAHP